mgnify:CR=1 FL=1
MSIVAQWLSKKWEVSPHRVQNISNLSTSYKLKTETSSGSNGSTVTKVLGLEPQQIKFESQISDAVGVNVEDEIKSWESLVGQSGVFYIGGKSFGRNKMQLTSVDVTETVIDDLGRIRSAKISFLFTEDTTSMKSSKKSNKTTAASSATYTALGISPSSADKSQKKPVNTQLSR